MLGQFSGTLQALNDRDIFHAYSGSTDKWVSKEEWEFITCLTAE